MVFFTGSFQHSHMHQSARHPGSHNVRTSIKCHRSSSAAQRVASVLVSVPQRTAEAVSTTAAGTAAMLEEARRNAAVHAGKTPVGRAAARANKRWEATAAELPKVGFLLCWAPVNSSCVMLDSTASS